MVTLYSLLMNTYKHGNFTDKIKTGSEVCQTLASYIHSEYFLVHQYIQVLASHINGEWHYTPFGIFRRNSNAVFTLFVEFYGVEKGAEVFTLYKKATSILQDYPRYKLAMVLVCSVLNLLTKSPKKMLTLGDRQWGKTSENGLILKNKGFLETKP